MIPMELKAARRAVTATECRAPKPTAPADMVTGDFMDDAVALKIAQ